MQTKVFWDWAWSRCQAPQSAGSLSLSSHVHVWSMSLLTICLHVCVFDVHLCMCYISICIFFLGWRFLKVFSVHLCEITERACHCVCAFVLFVCVCVCFPVHLIVRSWMVAWSLVVKAVVCLVHLSRCMSLQTTLATRYLSVTFTSASNKQRRFSDSLSPVYG